MELWKRLSVALLLFPLLLAAPRPAAAVLQGSINSGIDLTDTAAGTVEAVTNVIKQLKGWSVTDGVAANQANRFYAATRTLAASATEDLDLSGTTLLNQYGAVVFVKVKAILVIAATTNTNNVNFSRPAANGVPIFAAVSDAISIPPGGWVMLAAPGLAGLATVTASTADLITFTNSGAGTGVTYTILIIGTSS